MVVNTLLGNGTTKSYVGMGLAFQLGSQCNDQRIQVGILNVKWEVLNVMPKELNMDSLDGKNEARSISLYSKPSGR